MNEELKKIDVEIEYKKDDEVITASQEVISKNELKAVAAMYKDKQSDLQNAQVTNISVGLGENKQTMNLPKMREEKMKSKYSTEIPKEQISSNLDQA